MDKKTRSPLLSARIDWIALEILIIFGLTLIYTVVIFIDESKNISQTLLETWKATTKEVVPSFHLTTIFVVGAFEFGGEIMLRYTAIIQKALDKGKAEGKAEGKTEIYQAWYADWERRKQEALEKGITFNDPPPPKPEDIKEDS